MQFHCIGKGWAPGKERSVALVGLLISAVLLCYPAIAFEQWDCHFLTDQSGAQFAEVRDILEDNDGRIWAASWGNGVACIDANSWTTYSSANGLASDWVRGLARGSDGTIWMSTPGGLCCYYQDALRCNEPAVGSPLEGDEPDLIFMSQSGDLLLSTFLGKLLRLKGVSRDATLVWSENAPWETLISKEARGGARMIDICEDEQGLVYFSMCDNSWWVLDGDALEMRGTLDSPLQLTLGRDAEGVTRVWAGMDGRSDLLNLQAGEWRIQSSVPTKIRKMRQGQDGYVYVGTTSGLFRLDESGAVSVDLGRHLGFPDINYPYFSRDGSLWLGTREGLARGAPSSWKNYARTRENNPIIGMIHDPTAVGDVLAVDEANGVCRLQEDTWVRSFQLDAPEPLDTFLTPGTEPYVWALGAMHLYQFNLADGKRVASLPIPQTTLNRKLFMPSTGELWLAASDGVFALREGAWVALPAVEGYKQRTVNNVAESTPGVFYAGFRDGIERWEGDSITYFDEADGISEVDEVYTVCPTRDGDIWFGTYGSGVYAYDGAHFEHIDEKNGLSHHSVSNIIETSDSTIWLSYRRVGVASYRDGRWLNFGYDNGLSNAPIVQLMEDGQGTLWLSSAGNGLYRYRPDTEAPETRVTTSSEAVPYRGLGVFSFHAVDAWQRTPTHALLYSWRVLDEGSGEDLTPWTNFSPATSYITDELPPGHYRFEVRASDDARNVDPTPAIVTFNIAGPFWLHPHVLIPSILLLIVCVIAIVMRARAHRALHRSRVALIQSNQQLMNEIKERIQAEKRLNDHFEQLEELVKGRTAELEVAQRALVEQERLATLGKVTASVSHELRNPLGTLRSTLFMIGRKIQGHNLGLEEAIARGERSIQRCDRIIEEFLDFTRTLAMERESIYMDDWLGEVLRDMQLPASIQCECTYTSGITLEVDPERLRRAVINIVNNAVQAMNDNSGDFQRLHIKSRVRGGRYEIVVKDNGPGISEQNLARIFEPLYSTKGFGVGLGVPIVKGIMLKHNGGVEYHSVVGQGTTVVLWMPAGPPLHPEAFPERGHEAAREDHRADHEPHDEKDNPENIEQTNSGESEIVGFHEPQDRQEKSEE